MTRLPAARRSSALFACPPQRIDMRIAMCKPLHMPTNLAIDDDLLEEARRVGGHRTKKDTVNDALREYVQRRRQAKIVEFFGSIEFDPGYDHKKQRRRP